uniref:Uncharacterized protein n=1 Tax=Physcomitrium patens TaxID=3218 RepID=A0A2K1K8E1_PHYPA|nr:hypothetical protein PHYPA_011940 [Physcomitrium patens]
MERQSEREQEWQRKPRSVHRVHMGSLPPSEINLYTTEEDLGHSCIPLFICNATYSARMYLLA